MAAGREQWGTWANHTKAASVNHFAREVAYSSRQWLPEANAIANSRPREQSALPVPPACSLGSKSAGFGTEANTVANSWPYWLTGEYITHYHAERAHQGIGNERIEQRSEVGDGAVRCTERLGGLLKCYRRAA